MHIFFLSPFFSNSLLYMQHFSDISFWTSKRDLIWHGLAFSWWRDVRSCQSWFHFLKTISRAFSVLQYYHLFLSFISLRFLFLGICWEPKINMFPFLKVHLNCNIREKQDFELPTKTYIYFSLSFFMYLSLQN